jgi:hypothetical protein
VGENRRVDAQRDSIADDGSDDLTAGAAAADLEADAVVPAFCAAA